MEITQMAPVHPNFPLQESTLTLTGARLPGESIPRVEQSETEFLEIAKLFAKYLN
jgi:hypothetical protein